MHRQCSTAAACEIGCPVPRTNPVAMVLCFALIRLCMACWRQIVHQTNSHAGLYMPFTAVVDMPSLRSIMRVDLIYLDSCMLHDRTVYVHRNMCGLLAFEMPIISGASTCS